MSDFNTQRPRLTAGGPAAFNESECHPLDSHNKVLASPGMPLIWVVNQLFTCVGPGGVVDDCVGAG